MWCCCYCFFLFHYLYFSFKWMHIRYSSWWSSIDRWCFNLLDRYGWRKNERIKYNRKPLISTNQFDFNRECAHILKLANERKKSIQLHLPFENAPTNALSLCDFIDWSTSQDWWATTLIWHSTMFFFFVFLLILLQSVFHFFNFLFAQIRKFQYVCDHANSGIAINRWLTPPHNDENCIFNTQQTALHSIYCFHFWISNQLKSNDVKYFNFFCGQSAVLWNWTSEHQFAIRWNVLHIENWNKE